MGKNNASDFCRINIESVLSNWWKLASRIIVKYNDGCKTTTANQIMKPIDYSKEWLKQTGYYNGPIIYKEKGVVPKEEIINN